MSSPFYFTAIVTKDNTSPVIANLPPGADVETVLLHRDTVFDAGTTLSVGYASNHTAYCAATAVDATGTARPALGSGGGRDTTPRAVTAYLSGVPTVGKCIVLIAGYFTNPTI